MDDEELITQATEALARVENVIDTAYIQRLYNHIEQLTIENRALRAILGNLSESTSDAAHP